YGRHRQGHRNALNALVMAECVEGKGRYLNDIIDGVWAHCEESWWGKPWHLSNQKMGADLIDISEASVDLFVAETASLLSWTCYLLGPQLDAFSTLVLPRVYHEMQQRILAPCLERDDHHWMGFGSAGKNLHRVNNWNPWIISNWITSILLMEKDSERRVVGLHKSMRALDRFIDPYPKDGGCDEGPGYWGRAGASMFECLESLHDATKGEIDVYDDPLIQDIGKFIMRVQIHDHYFVNFADASPLVSPSAFLLYRYGKRIADADMMGLGAYFNAEENEARKGGGDSIARVLPALLLRDELTGVKPYQPLPRDAWLPEIQVVTARDKMGSSEGFYVAAKGGHNQESHNHNDVGHYIVYIDGAPVIIDAGVGPYTGKTFSSKRYDIWTMQSAYHSLPTIDGVMQSNGLEFAARDASCETGEEETAFSVDIAGAYPSEANLKTWLRTVTLERGQAVRIEDGYVLSQPVKKIQMSLLTPCVVNVSSGRIELTKRDLSEDRSSGEACIHYDTDVMTVGVEKIVLEDGKTQRYWGDELSRILFTLSQPQDQGEVVLRVTR
ncbi:MAG: heparinase, partial [Candidatus Latescibacteria bacterium]|nr:heparinase [Candidatus Latescibacterota bacterium]